MDNGQGSRSHQHEQYRTLPKRKPPPIPKRNPNTCLSSQVPPRPTTLTKSLDNEPLKKSPYHNPRQYSATLPRHSQRLDICAELLNYISELTQELMAETSFTEVSLIEDSNDIGNTWSSAKQSSVAIQTEDIPAQKVFQKGGRSIGTQVNKTPSTLPDNDKQAKLHLERQSPSKPFKTIKKMLKEGSIEGIEDNPPVFKPPPPPTAYADPVSFQKQVVEQYKQPVTSRPISSKVAKHLSTFEPPIDNKLSCQTSFSEIQKAPKPKLNSQMSFSETQKATNPKLNNQMSFGEAQKAPNPKLNGQMSFGELQKAPNSLTLNKSPQVTVSAVPPFQFVSSTYKSPSVSSEISPVNNTVEYPKPRKQTRSLAFVTKAETVDHCFHQRLSPAVSEKQIQMSNTPPPPPVGKEPPPKIVVEVPPKKHRQNSSCGTTCSCLCLKRQSPCGSPVSSTLGSHPQNSPFTPMKNVHYSTAKNKEEKVQFTTGGVSARDEAYNALIEEIRFAIKRRQNGDDKEEDALS